MSKIHIGDERWWARKVSNTKNFTDFSMFLKTDDFRKVCLRPRLDCKKTKKNLAFFRQNHRIKETQNANKQICPKSTSVTNAGGRERSQTQNFLQIFPCFLKPMIFEKYVYVPALIAKNLNFHKKT